MFWKDMEVLKYPPNENYDYNGTEGKSVSVTKGTGHGKLLVAYNNEEKHLADMTQNLETNGKSGYYLVANPYTSSISMKKFFEVNTGFEKKVWLVDGGEVKAFDVSSKDVAILPTQSFFVKKTGSATSVRFTSAMYIDRTITTGLQMASDMNPVVSVKAMVANQVTSEAKIALREDASADYDTNEDVELLYDRFAP